MSYKLYYASGACSMAVHVILNELDQPVDLIKIDTKAPRPANLLAINPRGSVPVLIDNGTPIREGAAIISYLCDKHQSSLLPRDGLARATALEWLMWCNATLHPSYSRFFWLSRTAQDTDQKAALIKESMSVTQSLWDEAEIRLSKNAYLAGDAITAADILLCVIANWNAWLPEPMHFGDHVKRLIRDVTARPAYQKAIAIEGVDYKAAA
jgi:glutathione S-transferase